MRIVVTGAAGMLGRDVVRTAEAAGHETLGLPRAELDVTHAEAVARRLTEHRPDVVVNCAAFTDVDGAEDDLRAAMEANAEGARNVAAAAAALGAKVVYPSTDYVFDGSKGGPYVESDRPRPQSVYGQSKLAGEHETADANAGHLIVRSSWLFGPGGRNFVEAMLTLARDHGEVVVVRDQVGCPTYTGHLADAILDLLAADASGIHHVAGAGECSWHDFALEIFDQAAIPCRVKACTTEELGRPAPRPAYSALASERSDALRLPHWKDGLASYLAEGTVAA